MMSRRPLCCRILLVTAAAAMVATGVAGTVSVKGEASPGVLDEIRAEGSGLGKTMVGYVAEYMARKGMISKEDIQIYASTGRQSRAGDQNPMAEMAFDVFREIVSTLLTKTLGGYLGFTSTERTSTVEDFDFAGMVMEGIQKNVIKKRMGCPT